MLPRDEQIPSAHCPGADPQQEEWCGLCGAPSCGRLLWEGAGLLTLVQGLLMLAGVAVRATVSPWQACRVVPPCWPREQFMPDLTSNLTCHCCGSSWVPVGRCVFGSLEGSERGHTGSPSSAPQGSWKAHSW